MSDHLELGGGLWPVAPRYAVVVSIDRKDGVQMRDGCVGVFGELAAKDREALEPEYGRGG
jgi:hypothetical protein